MGISLSFVVVPLFAKDVATETNLEKMPLAGTWSFRLDAEDVGVKEKWFAKTFDDTVQLPGTTDENHKGIKKDEQCTDRLSRVWYWKGPAWYQRKVTIPETWKGKRITLFLERTKYTRIWVDQTFCGGEDTLSAPQLFELPQSLTPGEHTLTVLIDNAKLPPVGPAHAVDERTQTNWNGILGIMELRATSPVWLDDVQIYPDAAKKQARVRAVIGNITGKAASGRLTARCESYNVAKPSTFKTQTIDVMAAKRETVVEFIYEPGADVPLWDEFQPALLHLNIKLETAIDGLAATHQQSIRFGMRDFKREGQRFAINNRTVFLRGRVDCANYPLTGYPPMDVDAWRRVLGILKAWGLNHVRFHSWCPPEAAFVAADELGVYLQPELPNKRSAFNAPDSKEASIHNIDWLDMDNTLKTKSLYAYAKREGELIFKSFGNHPSFVMFTLGNELGRNPGMFEMVAHYKQIDPRHLYAQGANNMHWDPSLADGDDFWVTGKTGKKLPVRGAFFPGDFPRRRPHLQRAAFDPDELYGFDQGRAGAGDRA
jgi:beta-galactosidase/beta-glucuronidase